MSAPAPRVPSVTRSQAADAGIELIQLCQTINADGHLLEPQVSVLKQWSVKHRDVDLPARDKVMTTLDGIIAHGTITDAARQELQRALEAVLPPEVRRLSGPSLRITESSRYSRNLPIETFEFMVANPTSENRGILTRFATAGDEVVLVRDRQSANGHRPLLVRLVSGHDIGVVPEADARAMSRHLDQNLRYRARLKQIVSGEHAPVAVVVAEVYHDDAVVAELRRGVEPKGPPLAISTMTSTHEIPIPQKSYAGVVLASAAAFLIFLAVAVLV